MTALTLVRTAPDFPPGSMSAYARLVEQALASVGTDDFAVRVCDLFSPSAGGSMWRHHLWRLRHARRVFAQHPSRLYHLLDGSMAAFVPRSLLGHTLVTVHDLIPLLQMRGELPGRKPSLPAAWMIRRASRALRRCRGVAADSSHTALDLRRLIGPRFSTVIPLAVRALPECEPIPGHVLPERFLLHVGNNADYKNRMGVLRIFARLRDVADLHLFMAGPEPTSALRHFAETHALRVTFPGPLSDGQLHTLYRRAALLLFPSRYEGFGMPVLEAMAAGCPVVCSTAGSLLEVAADAALSAPADDEATLAGQCRALMDDARLREEMVRRGLARAGLFDLKTMGLKLVEAYRCALGEGA